MRDHQVSVPAATVLYQPDQDLLNGLLGPLERDGRKLYIFVNGPIEDVIEARLATLPDAVVIRSTTNVGLGAALNEIMMRAASDGFKYILLFDQDSTPSSELPELLLAQIISRDPADRPLAAVGPRLVPPQNSSYKPLPYAWSNRRKHEVYFLPTSGSLISIPVWLEVGPFRADYFIGGIDVEWGLRANGYGFASVVASDVSLVHRWGLPTDDNSRNVPQILRQSDLRKYYYIRNAVDCLRQPFAPLGWKLRYSANLAAQLIILMGARHFSKNMRNLIAQSFVAGLKGRLGPASGMNLSDSAHK